VIFVERTGLPFLKRMERYLDPLVDRLATSVETLVYTPNEFRDMTGAGFMKKALEEGMILYERGEI
jgi:hypothetical protein